MRFTTVITKEEKWFVSRCLELGVVSQGKTVEAAQQNLVEATELYLEGEPALKKYLRSMSAPMVTTMELRHA